MAMNIYVGNLARSATADDLLKLFSPHGNVCAAQIIINRKTGESRGFGFVDMEHTEDALRAIQSLNGAVHDNQPLDVRFLGSRRSYGKNNECGAVTASSRSETNGAVNPVAGRLPPELLDWARREFTEQEILTGVRQIRETGGVEFKDLIEEIDDILFSPYE
jgi:RNA recognition motif-containing protein